MELWLGFAVRALLCAAVSATLCAVLIRMLWPLLVRYAMAIPNARSSHRVPTPQGGGIAVVIASAATALGGAMLLSGAAADVGALVPVLAGAGVLAVVGAFDDVHGVPIVPRLLLQALVVVAIVALLPAAARIVPQLPLWLERTALVVAGVWFVNLTNFMDGLDWMTVAEVVPITAALALIGALGGLPSHGILLALALGGATLGFAPFNRPVARLFLGDVGSLPVGLLLGYLLLLLALEGHAAAAIILPLYYLADTGLTLVRRMARREPFWQAHRSHFYQHATNRGLTVGEIVARVFAVNVALAACAVATVLRPGLLVASIALVAAIALVGLLLTGFARGRP